MDILHFYFMRSSVDGHLRGFQLLAVWIMLLWICTYSCLCTPLPRSGIAGSYGDAVFYLPEALPIYFPQWLYCFSTSTSSVWGLQSLHILPTSATSCFFHCCYCDRWHLMWFWFAFPWWLVMLSIFSCLSAAFMSSFEKYMTPILKMKKQVQKN